MKFQYKVLILFILLVLVSSVFVIRNTSKIENELALSTIENTQCSRFTTPPLYIIKAIEFGTGKQSMRFSYFIFQLLFNSGTFSDSQSFFSYMSAMNLSKDSSSLFKNLRIILLAFSLRSYISNDNEAFCIYIRSTQLNSINGLDKAAQHYFGKKIHHLTLTEAVRLASVLSFQGTSPYSHNNDFKYKVHSILKNLFQINVISEEDYKLSLDEFKIRKEP